MNENSKIPSIIKRRYDKCKELMQPRFEQIEINRNLYAGVLNIDDAYEWDYNLVDPHVFPLVRNYLSRANPSSIYVWLRNRRPDTAEVREINQSVINWELGEMLLTNLFYRTFFSGFIGGRGYIKTGWKYQKAIKIQSRDEAGNIISEKVMRDILNRADGKYVRFNDLLIPNRNLPTLEDQPFVIEQVQQRIGDMIDENESLEEKGDKPYWDKNWLAALKKSGVKDKLLDYQMDIATDADSEDDFAFKSAYIPLLCLHNLEGDMFYIPLEGDEKIVNSDTTNKYWHGHYPYISFAPFPEDDEFLSLGLVDVVGDSQIAATEILNQTLSNIRQINTDMWIKGSGASQTPDWEFTKRPNGVVNVVGDISQVQQIRTQDNTASALRFSQQIQSNIERAGGISSLYSSGAPSKAVNQTARGAQIIDRNIDTNMQMILDLYSEQIVKPMAEHFLELNAQFLTEEQTFYITGRRGVREFVTITPDQVTANFDVEVNADRMTKQSPASVQTSLQNLMTNLTSVAQQAGLILDLVPITETLIDSYPEMDNVEDVVVSVDEKSKRDISMVERGQLPEIKARDPHRELIVLANIHFTENEGQYPEEIAVIFEQYVQKHLAFIQGEQEVAMMSQPQIPQAGSPVDLQAQMGGSVGSPSPEMVNQDQIGDVDQTYGLGQIA